MWVIVLPFLLSLIAGSATGLGSIIVYSFGDIDERLLGFLMGFAGGVMLIVSFLNLFDEALHLLGSLLTAVSFAVGALVMMTLDLSTPHMEFGGWEPSISDLKLLKTGLTVAIGVSIHNFPEGLIISAGYTHIPRLGILIAIIVCLHNIPEGIATAAPLIAAGMKRKKAVGISLLSGMSEPVGALVGATILFIIGPNTHIIGVALGLAAGVMTYITVDELIPIAHEYCTATNKHYISTGLLLGMIFGIFLSVAIQV